MQSQSRNRLLRIFTTIGRFLMGFIFILTAYSKMKPLEGFPWSIASLKLSLAMFATAVDGYRLLPSWAVSAVAHSLPFIELALGLWLLLGLALRFSAFLSTLAIAVFFVGQMSAYLRNMQIPCGCGLIPGEQIGPLSLSLDAVLVLLCLGLTLSALRLHKHRASTPAPLETRVV
jgi:uncharacterized membrane protein YphA (DoxX/SURF4 family)